MEKLTNERIMHVTMHKLHNVGTWKTNFMLTVFKIHYTNIKIVNFKQYSAKLSKYNSLEIYKTKNN